MAARDDDGPSQALARDDADEDGAEPMASSSASTVGRWCGLCWEGQTLDLEFQEKVAALDAPWTVRYRKELAMAIPFVLVEVVWWTAFCRWNSWHKFTDKIGQSEQYRHQLHSSVRPWWMSVTMVFGSLIAGATSEGGAAVAFPVMTLAFDVTPVVAKQFGFMIQSVGMSAAAFVILYMRVRIEHKSLIYCNLGGIAGVIFGLEKVAPVLTPPYAKMYFVVIWASFAASLFLLNRIRGRRTYLVMNPPHLPEVWRSANLVRDETLAVVLNWKAMVLFAAGFLGGVFTSFSGSGIDICSFAVLTLLFRISEKTATPTSVILMAVNTVVAMCYSKWMTREGLEPLAWEFFTVCAPIVVVGAPLGAALSSYLHRTVLAAFIYAIDAVQLVTALVVVRPWSHEKCHKRGPRTQHPGGRWRGTNCEPLHLCWSSALLLVSGLALFYCLANLGETLIRRNDVTEDAKGLRAVARPGKIVESKAGSPPGDDGGGDEANDTDDDGNDTTTDEA